MSTNETDVPPPSKPIIRFRNYQPQPSTVQVEKPSPAKTEVVDDVVPQESEPVHPSQPLIDPIKKELQVYAQNDDALNIVPRKANWDLKNMVAKKLEKLERRTQLAIVDILREKLNAEESNSNDGE